MPPSDICHRATYATERNLPLSNIQHRAIFYTEQYRAIWALYELSTPSDLASMPNSKSRAIWLICHSAKIERWAMLAYKSRSIRAIASQQSRAIWLKCQPNMVAFKPAGPSYCAMHLPTTTKPIRAQRQPTILCGTAIYQRRRYFVMGEAQILGNTRATFWLELEFT